MARLAKKPILIPKGLEVNIEGQKITAKGPKGKLEYMAHSAVKISKEGDSICVILDSDQQTLAKRGTKTTNAIWGAAWAHINNMVFGVLNGFEKKLLLVGVGYRAQVQGRKLNLSLGFSHPTIYEAPETITIEMPSQTEIIVRGINRQLVGQVAAEIRAVRPVEPYKGKGVRYSNESVILKETKKK